MSGDLLEYLSNAIDEERKVISEDMSRGNAKSYEDYRHACGVIRGLNIANDIIFQMSKRMEEFDD